MNQEIRTHPAYPEWLENWWLQRVVEHIPTISSIRDLDALTTEVQQLSDLFIREGSEVFDTYDHDPRVLLAYGLFYFPQTFVRIQWPLQELLYHRGWHPPLHRPMKILDLGAGLGSASLGALQVLQEWYETSQTVGANKTEQHSHFQITAVDHASQSLQWNAKLTRDLAEHWPHTSWQTRSEDLLRYGTPVLKEALRSSKSPKKSPKEKHRPHRSSRSKGGKHRSFRHNPSLFMAAPEEEPWDLIVSSFALTEVFREQSAEQMWQWLQGLMARLAPEGMLLLMEPASQDSCERLEAIRDQVASTPPFTIWGPCLHDRLCPLRKSGRAWCHEVRHWDIPSSLKGLNRRMYRSLQALKFGYLALGHAPPPKLKVSSPQPFRMIAPMAKQKGRWITTGCASHGELIKFEIFTRDLTTSSARGLETLNRGDIVEASELIERPNPNQYRLTPGATLTCLHPEKKSITLHKKEETS